MQLNNQDNAKLGMFVRPGFGSVSFRDSVQTASLFSYNNLHDDNTINSNTNNINEDNSKTNNDPPSKSV